MRKIVDKVKTVIGEVKVTGGTIPGLGIHWERKTGADSARVSKEIALFQQLIEFVWDYPHGPGNQASWAVKESMVLRRLLDTAREQPGLGAAIASTEFASRVFGKAANHGIDICIQWAIAKTDPKPPHFFLSEFADPVTSRVKEVPDFRHTLTLAIILARNNRYPSRLEGYVDTVLADQRQDGGWMPGGGTTVSEVVTVLYAIQLLHEYVVLPDLSDNKRLACITARDRALRWLMDARTPTGLWSSGVLSEYSWENLWTSSWVLHRLCRLDEVNVTGWRGCFVDGLSTMIQRTLNPDSWTGTDLRQRNIVEARIAASVRNARTFWGLKGHPLDLANSYLDGWKHRALGWLKSLDVSEIDLATAVFLLESLFEPSTLVRKGSDLLSMQAQAEEEESCCNRPN
uniref:Prenyltransferase-like n=1 Tax=Candidatus Kentrum sp. UNK TaxID=2126344 RepID=A0A451ABX7_9GAMM|nr:MAG: Prenyltransferase-like [Candidatus Kentron sp. UNK]VFK70851.1 MAG: Prenyltransferase-like [Candidatus Kentron sp. UNK]